jgi:hypothetical protein
MDDVVEAVQMMVEALTPTTPSSSSVSSELQARISQHIE